MIGLIADTHMPERCPKLPETVFQAFAGVDLILHAGDVGELWVLDALSRIAPVVAVHGNDEADPATARALPYLQTITAAGNRVVLTHAHYPDRVAEMESRRDDRWGPKLARRAQFGLEHESRIVVFGHTHIPMVTLHDGVWLINPGAIAPSSFTMRQKVRTVARLHLRRGQPPQVRHIDLDQPQQSFRDEIDVREGFHTAYARFSESILEPALETEWHWLTQRLNTVDPDWWRELFMPMMRRCWAGEQAYISVADIMTTLQSDPALVSVMEPALNNSPVFKPYLS
jgi:uncharacterized protein